MPFYAYIYVFLLFLAAFASTYIHQMEGRKTFAIILEIISALFQVSFVILYYSPDYLAFQKEFILIPIIYCLIFDFWNYKMDIRLAQEKFGVTPEEMGIPMAVAVTFFIPAYCAAFGILF